MASTNIQISKELLQTVLGIMTETAKAQNTKTIQDVELDLEVSRMRTIPYKKLYTYLCDNDDFCEEESERLQNIQENYNLTWFIHQKMRLPNKDDWDELTEKQQWKLGEMTEREAHKEHKIYMKDIWECHIKNKRFTTVNSLVKAFMDHY